MRSRAGALAVLAAVAAAAQEPRQPVFRSDVTLIEVEVSVLDKDRKPVRGLTAADFSIFEEGKPQEIQTFAEIELPPPPATAWMRDVGPDVRSNAPRQGRLIALLLDDAHIDLIRVKPAREIARRLIEALSPGDLASVVFTRWQGRAQEFTDDRAKLLASVEYLYPQVAGARMRPPPSAGAGTYSYTPTADTGDKSPEMWMRKTVDSIRHIAELMGDAPKRRKVIFYVTPGIPLDMAAGSSAMLALRAAMQAAIREAQRWNITLYPLDPSLRDLTSVLPTARREFLNTMAGSTGGFVHDEKADLQASVAQMFEETGSYYLLGYQTTRTEADGKFHPIVVRTSRPGVVVRARGGYRAAGPETGPALVANEVLPKSDLELSAFAAPFAAAGKEAPTLAIVVGVRHPSQGDGARTRESVELELRAYTPPQTQLKLGRMATFGFGLRDVGPMVAYELVSQVPLAPGRYQLRIGASSATRQKAGSVYYDVEVPDFAKEALSVSGVLVSAEPGPITIGADRLGSPLPVVPTSLREFSPDTKLTAFARVYQRSGKPPADVTSVLSVVNDAGRRVFRASESLPAAQFVGAAADYLREIPLAGLVPGAYLLTLEFKKDEQTSASRSVRFSVVPGTGALDQRPTDTFPLGR
jgi:VWFA-related protein